MPYRSGLRFQPTLPARGATARNLRASPGPGISTHAPRTGSDRPLVDGGRGILISTHAPRTGSDTGARIRPRFSATFQPTLPARGATSKPPKTSGGFEISTHAPRTGSDGGVPERHRAPLNFNPRSPHGERRRHRMELLRLHDDFNPRSPHGERHQRPHQPPEDGDFNPRSPHGERPSSLHVPEFIISFQPTLPARGATVDAAAVQPARPDFNPRSPHGERRTHYAGAQKRNISTHAPRTGSDKSLLGTSPAATISTHAPRTGSDLMKIV